MRGWVAVALLLILFSGTILVSHGTAEIFPWLPLALFSVSVLLLVADLSQQSRTVIATLSSSGYVATVFAFVHPSLIGRDPDKVAVAILRVIEFGGLEGLSGYQFYSLIPGFHLFTASVGQVLGITGKQALVLLGVCTPLFLVPGAVLLARSRSTPEATKYASIVMMVSTPMLVYSQRPIPQLFAVILWPSFLILFDGYVRKNVSSYFVALSLVTVALMYSHKLPLVVVLGASLAAVGVELVRKRWHADANVRKYVSLSVLFGILLILQHIWITDFFRAATTDILPGLFDDEAGAPGPIGVQGLQAARLLPRPIEIVVGNADWLVLTLFAGVGWCVVFLWMKESDTKQTVILGATAFSGLLIVSAFLMSEVAVRRVALFAVVPFAAIVATSFSILSISVPTSWRRFVTFFVIILVVCQLGVTVTTPDHSFGTRQYLSPEEVDGKQWTNEHSTDLVAADFEYAREIVDFDRPNQTYVTGESGVARGYIPVSEPYLNATVTEQGYPYILYRSKYTRYRTTYAWRLTWNPEVVFDRELNRVFDNGGSILYESL